MTLLIIPQHYAFSHWYPGLNASINCLIETSYLPFHCLPLIPSRPISPFAFTWFNELTAVRLDNLMIWVATDHNWRRPSKSVKKENSVPACYRIWFHFYPSITYSFSSAPVFCIAPSPLYSFFPSSICILFPSTRQPVFLRRGVGNGKQVSGRLGRGIHIIPVFSRTRITYWEIAQLRFRLNLFKVTILTDIRHKPLLLNLFVYFMANFIPKDYQCWYTHLNVSLHDVKLQAKNGEINKKVEHNHVFFRYTMEGPCLSRMT